MVTKILGEKKIYMDIFSKVKKNKKE